MQVVFHEAYLQAYTSDPAAAPGRLEAIIHRISDHVTFVMPEPASEDDLAAAHTEAHIQSVRRRGLFKIAALAAGGAIKAAEIGLTEPCFAVIRPPGHHASANSSWGFCYFNNMAVAILRLMNQNLIRSAYILDIDLHYGDGNVNILGSREGIAIFNPEANDRQTYLHKVAREMGTCEADMIGVSAGFDNHLKDWGGLLLTEDYHAIGKLVKEASQRIGGGCFGILEGGYNHYVLGKNTMALIAGMAGLEFEG